MKFKYRLNPHFKFDEVRLFRFFLATLIVLFFVATPLKAHAETGSITIVDETLKTYSSTNGGGVHPWNGTIMRVFNSTYNNLQQVTITLDAANNFAFQSNTTAFHITDNGTGTGYVVYSAYDRNITWFFSSGSITGEYVRLVYDDDIFDDISSGAGGAGSIVQGDSMPPDVSQPVYMATGFPGSNASSVKGKYYAWSGTQTTNSYILTYLQDNLFKLNVNKTVNGNINTRWTVHDYGNQSQYYSESSLNHDPIQVIRTQLTGIYANVSLISGRHSIITLNATQLDASGHVIGIPYTANNPPLTIPSSGGSIQFNKTQYTVGDTVRIEWAISNSSWQALGSSFRASLFKDGTQVFLTGDTPDLDISTQTGNFSFITQNNNVVGTGSYKVELWGGSLSTLFVQSVLSTAYTTVVPATPASLLVPSIAIAGQNITITYDYGAGKSTTNGFISDTIIQETFGIHDTAAELASRTFTQLSCPCATGTIYKSFVATGKHRLDLWDAAKVKVVASATIDITTTEPIALTNITTNSLALDNTVYSSNDVILGYYQISSGNYSSYRFFTIDLISASGIFSNSIAIPDGKQTGQFQLPVTSQVWNSIQSGAAYVNLTGASSVFGTPVVLASVPVTINIGRGPYTLSASPQTVCKNSPIYVKYTGAGGVGAIKVTYTTPAATTKIDIYNFSQNGTRIFTFDDGKVHDNAGIAFDLYDNAGNYQSVGTIVVYHNTGCTQAGTTPATPTPTPATWSKDTTNPGYTAGLIDGQVSLLGMGINNSTRFLFSMVWVILFLVGGFVVTGRNANGGLYAAMLPFLFFTSLSFVQAGVEFIPRYAVIIIAFILVIKLGIVR